MVDRAREGGIEREGEREREKERKRERGREREREGARARVCVCVCVRLCVSDREREKKDLDLACEEEEGGARADGGHVIRLQVVDHVLCSVHQCYTLSACQHTRASTRVSACQHANTSSGGKSRPAFRPSMLHFVIK